MKLDLPSSTGPLLRVEGHVDEKVIQLKFSGEADVEAKPEIDNVVRKIHEEALRLGAERIDVDLRQLEFMNSSCFKVFVSWLSSVQDLDTNKQYKIHLLSNPNLHWQRRSLAALSCFAVDLVTIST
jgi:anti-anti-sigma factor